MSKTKIYVIMTCTKLETDKKFLFPCFGSESIVGFYTQKEVAFEVVRDNWGDIYETCYDYAIIEEVEEGLYPCSTVRWFFKFNKDLEQYEQIPEPDSFKRFCGLII